MLGRCCHRHLRRCPNIFAICTTYTCHSSGENAQLRRLCIFMCVRCGFCQSHILLIICNNNNTRRQNVRDAFNISETRRLELDLLYFSRFCSMQSHCLVERNIWFLVAFSGAMRHAEQEGDPKYTPIVSLRILYYYYLNILLYFGIPEKSVTKNGTIETITRAICVRVNKPTGRPTKKKIM